MRLSVRRRLEAVQRYVGGDIRVGPNNVPLLVFEVRGKDASVVWFATRTHYRLFFPHGSEDQQRVNFNRPNLVFEAIGRLILPGRKIRYWEEDYREWQCPSTRLSSKRSSSEK